MEYVLQVTHQGHGYPEEIANATDARVCLPHSDSVRVGLLDIPGNCPPNRMKGQQAFLYQPINYEKKRSSSKR